MHLKGYQIDGQLLRTGAANFSVSGLKDQDNDLIVIQCEETATAFKNNYDNLFEKGTQIGEEDGRGKSIVPSLQPSPPSIIN
jgi:phosphatidylserine/phosphatidylglycerophosphate/cardiolipin synthase-like enzyme